MNTILIALYLQSCFLVNYDINDCTKKMIDKYKNIGVGEKNVVAKVFVDNDLYVPMQIGCYAFNYVALDKLNSIHPVLGYLSIATLTILEVRAISTWSIVKKDIKINSIVYIMEF